MKHLCKCLLVVLGLFAIPSLSSTEQDPLTVNVDNYVAAKTALHFSRVQKGAGGVNRWVHLRRPTPINQQRVTRMNRDTLYSSAIVNLARGATLELPDAGDRYMSATIIDESHYVRAIYHGQGSYDLEPQHLGFGFVMLVVRTFVDASSPEDVVRANRLQDKLQLKAQAESPYAPPRYDNNSLKQTGDSIKALAAQLPDAGKTYGNRSQVDPVRHLLGTAYGWGGLPESEVIYINVQPGLPKGAYSLRIGEVPVDGFWSISVYNADGYFQENPWNAYNVNNYTAKANPDGTVTVNFGGDPASDNYLPLTEGWNYVVRMYQPRQALRTGQWHFPSLKPLTP